MKRALITGASGGIGAELSRVLHRRHGARVALVARRETELRTVAADCGDDALVLPGDMGVADDCRRVVEDAARELGGLDLVVLNAAVSNHSLVDELESPEIFERMMRINYLGPARCAFHALPHLVKSRGQFVVVSSLQGKVGFPGFAAYAASKHALHGFFDSLRSELVDRGVAVTIVCPGPVDTGIDDNRPKNAPGVMSVTECAEQMDDAIAARQRELIMTAGGKLGVLLRPFAPDLLDTYLRKRIDEFYGG